MTVSCPYCGKVAACVDSTEIYGRSYGFIWLCRPCDAYVGCHGGTKTPKGTLANTELRRARKSAHAAFDQRWKRGSMTRGEAYEWLAREMNLPVERCHIGEFDERQCAEVVRIASECKQLEAKP